MPTIEVQLKIQRCLVEAVEESVRRLTATIGHPDMNAFHKAAVAAATVADLKTWFTGRSVRQI